MAEYLDGTEEQLENVLQYLVDLGTEEAIDLLLQRLDGPVSLGGERKQFHEAFEADSRLALALLTLDDLRAHTKLIGDALPYPYSGDDAVLKGLVYRDKDPIIPFAANPWNVAPMAQPPVENAVRHGALRRRMGGAVR
ncbi:MAG: hypothetical protein AAFS10_23165 [Myxococcota bacterium]